MVTQVFDLGVSDDSGYPEIDFSIPPNRRFDWATIGAMIDGEIPIDHDYLGKVDVAVKGKGKPFDVVYLSTRLMVSPRAWAGIESLGVSGLEWVTLKVNGEPYHVLSKAEIIDCLDHSQSRLQYFPSNRTKIMTIRKYVFNKAIIPEKAIFKIPEKVARIFVTPWVKAYFDSSAFRGFKFIDIENPPAGVPIG